jgi:MFS family permease
MIPPIYILATLFFHDLQSRAKAFGVISGMGGIGAAAGPLIGGLITTSFPEERQGEISGLSRAVSNLGSSLGTAIAGTILVSAAATGNHSYALAIGALALIGLVGFAAAIFLPRNPVLQRDRA